MGPGDQAEAEEAAGIVARALSRRAAADRPRFLRELLAHTAAGLMVIEGDQAAAEAVYKLADACVSRGGAMIPSVRLQEHAHRGVRPRLHSHVVGGRWSLLAAVVRVSPRGAGRRAFGRLSLEPGVRTDFCGKGCSPRRPLGRHLEQPSFGVRHFTCQRLVCTGHHAGFDKLQYPVVRPDLHFARSSSRSAT